MPNAECQMPNEIALLDCLRNLAKAPSLALPRRTGGGEKRGASAFGNWQSAS